MTGARERGRARRLSKTKNFGIVFTSQEKDSKGASWACSHVATLSLANDKTGLSAQTYHFSSELSPREARLLGVEGERNCQACPLSDLRGCYVAGHSLSSVYKAFLRGSYRVANSWGSWLEGLLALSKLAGFLRLGAYGNPSLIEGETLSRLFEGLTVPYTAYSRSWLLGPEEQAKSKSMMFSVFTPSEYARAVKTGARAYIPLDSLEGFDTVASQGGRRLVECLYSSRGLSCRECKLCNGSSGPENVDIFIPLHGALASRARESIALLRSQETSESGAREAKKGRVFEGLRQGLSLSRACEQGGVSRRSFARWLTPEEREALSTLRSLQEQEREREQAKSKGQLASQGLLGRGIARATLEA